MFGLPIVAIRDDWSSCADNKQGLGAVVVSGFGSLGGAATSIRGARVFAARVDIRLGLM
jgi:hypothetical protein